MCPIMITQYQYERLAYLLENKELDPAELKMIDDMLASEWFEHDNAVVNWIMEWLRKKPSREPHGTTQRFLQGCRCPLCYAAYEIP
jgi:hypothetical protein